jgi:hypothetical protein
VPGPSVRWVANSESAWCAIFGLGGDQQEPCALLLLLARPVFLQVDTDLLLVGVISSLSGVNMLLVEVLFKEALFF